MNEKILDTGVKACSESKHLPAPYYAKVLGHIETKPGSWNYLRVGVYERSHQEDDCLLRKHSDIDRLIGEYTRTFPNPKDTFHPFELRGKWYALYSSHYGYTNLMELPSCKDIGGEERDEDGCNEFCPVEFWVPPLSYREIRHQVACPRHEDVEHADPAKLREGCSCTIVHRQNCPSKGFSFWRTDACICQEEWDLYEKNRYYWRFPDRIHGFVAGCYWGDDSSWKIQYLDLSRADEGILVRDERFGRVELPEQLSLSKAIRIEEGGKYNQITLTLDKHFNLATGKEGDEDD
jgi:hypothetical protein